MKKNRIYDRVHSGVVSRTLAVLLLALILCLSAIPVSAAASVKLNKAKITLNAVTLAKKGHAVMLKATAKPGNSNNRKVTWSSSDKNVARVNSKGKVTAVGAGACTVTATAKDGSGVSASCAVTVNDRGKSSGPGSGSDSGNGNGTDDGTDSDDGSDADTGSDSDSDSGSGSGTGSSTSAKVMEFLIILWTTGMLMLASLINDLKREAEEDMNSAL